jgi:hypothetical protein
MPYALPNVHPVGYRVVSHYNISRYPIYRIFSIRKNRRGAVRTQPALQYMGFAVTPDSVGLIDSGVVDVDLAAELPALAPPHVRLYRRTARALPCPGRQALPVVALIELLDEGVRAFRTLSRRDELPGQHAAASTGWLGISPHGHVHALGGASPASMAELLAAWLRGAGDGEVLLELAPGSAAWRVIAERLRRAPRLAKPAPALVPHEVAGAAERRAALMQSWLSSTGVAVLLGRHRPGPDQPGRTKRKTLQNPGQPAAVLRAQGRLLGVWVDAERGFRHPDCQFDGDQVLDVMAGLLALLPPGRGSGWSQAEWLYSPHALLDGRPPAELLATDPARVLAAARHESAEDTR